MNISDPSRFIAYVFHVIPEAMQRNRLADEDPGSPSHDGNNPPFYQQVFLNKVFILVQLMIDWDR